MYASNNHGSYIAILPAANCRQLASAVRALKCLLGFSSAGRFETVSGSPHC